MWELIHANKRNSIILIALMATALVVLGYIIGTAFDPQRGGFTGIIIASIIAMVLTITSFAAGDQILLSASGAVKVTHDVHPQLFNIVEEMKIAANLPKMPDIYIINDPAPNAFATGRSPEKASIAVTAGLLGKLNRDELQGVIAHEMSHILNRDILFVMVAGIMLGTIVLISEVFLRGMFYRSRSTRRYSSRENAQGQAVIMVIALLAAILAPIFAQLLYFAISRKREYLADASGVRLTRYPDGLAGALEKIAYSPTQLATANKVNAPMFIVNPFMQAKASLSSLMSTHPPIEERIKILRSMSFGAGYKDYAQSFKTVTGKKPIVPTSMLAENEDVTKRSGQANQSPAPKEQKRTMGDVMAKVNNFQFVNCTCGLRLKLPPAYKGHEIECPRCNRKHNVT